MNNTLTIGEKIREIRNRKNLSQKRFGEKIGISGKSISAYETGKCTPPLKILECISKEYDESIIQLRDDRRKDLTEKIKYIKESISEIENILDRSLSL